MTSSEKFAIGLGSLIAFCVLSVFVIAFAALLNPTATSGPPAPYKVSEEDLRVVIDEGEGYEILDVRHALTRLTEKRISDYPFYAFNDPQGNGFLAIIAGIPSPSGNTTGAAVFLVSPEALNQTKIADLNDSIKAVNGLAKSMAPGIDFAKGYNYLDVMRQVEERAVSTEEAATP